MIDDQPGVDSAGKPIYPADRMWESIGNGHWIDRYDHGTGTELGFHILHTQPATGRWCMSGVQYAPMHPDGWTLVALDPIHIEPSVLCRAPNGPIDPTTGFATLCSDHGFIRGGVWVPA